MTLVLPVLMTINLLHPPQITRKRLSAAKREGSSAEQAGSAQPQVDLEPALLVDPLLRRPS